MSEVDRLRSNFERLIKESYQAAKVLNSEINRVSGQGGILQRLNEAHINALNRLVNNLNDKSAINRVLDILKREEKVLDICQNGLSEYKKLLERLGPGSAEFLKRKLLNDVGFLLSVIEKIRKRILRLLKRVDLERRILNQFDTDLTPKKIKQLIGNLKKEESDIRKIIKQCKPKEIGRLRIYYLNLNQSMYATVFKDTDIINAYVIGLLVGLSPIILLALIILPISCIFDILDGLTIDDRELRAEIEELRKAA